MTQAMTAHFLTPANDAAPRTLVAKAYRALRRDIIEGRLAPGCKLRVEHLKQDYAVGAGTLREALSLLVADALVYAEGQRGFYVAPMSLDDLEDLTNQRVLLETTALRQSIVHGDARWEAELHSAFAALSAWRNDSDQLDVSEFELRNRRFHDALIAGHASPWTHHLLGVLNRHSERYRFMTLQLVAAHGVERDVDAEHETIYRAAIARQDARAALALEAHVRATCDIVRSALAHGKGPQNSWPG